MCVQPCVPDDDPSPTTTVLPLSYYMQQCSQHGKSDPHRSKVILSPNRAQTIRGAVGSFEPHVGAGHTFEQWKLSSQSFGCRHLSVSIRAVYLLQVDHTFYCSDCWLQLMMISPLPPPRESVNVYVHGSVCVCASRHTCVSLRACVRVCVRVRVCVCMCACVCVFVRVRACVLLYMGPAPSISQNVSFRLGLVISASQIMIISMWLCPLTPAAPQSAHFSLPGSPQPCFIFFVTVSYDPALKHHIFPFFVLIVH